MKKVKQSETRIKDHGGAALESKLIFEVLWQPGEAIWGPARKKTLPSPEPWQGFFSGPSGFLKAKFGQEGLLKLGIKAQFYDLDLGG